MSDRSNHDDSQGKTDIGQLLHTEEYCLLTPFRRLMGVAPTPSPIVAFDPVAESLAPAKTECRCPVSRLGNRI